LQRTILVPVKGGAWSRGEVGTILRWERRQAADLGVRALASAQRRVY
jgi:hypothetical protein